MIGMVWLLLSVPNRDKRNMPIIQRVRVTTYSATDTAAKLSRLVLNTCIPMELLIHTCDFILQFLVT